MTIPRLSERLECMLYRRKLELEVEEIRPELNIVHMAAKELRSSTKFKRVLQVGSNYYILGAFNQQFLGGPCGWQRT